MRPARSPANENSQHDAERAWQILVALVMDSRGDWRRQQWAALQEECRHPLRALREAWSRAW